MNLRATILRRDFLIQQAAIVKFFLPAVEKVLN
jgi:hypothetical protein